MGKCDGKVALVTGAARGIGAAVAADLVAEGARVVLCDVRDDLGRRRANELGTAASFRHLDVSEADQWEAAIVEAEERHGRLDVLVNNAGVSLPGTIETASLETYHRSVAVNQTGVWLGIRYAAPALRAAGGGSIVNVSSLAAYFGHPTTAAYGMTKWAVRGLTKSAAVDLAKDQIRVNSVHPGIIATDMVRELGLEDAGREVGAGWAPLGRVGEAEDVAKLVSFLASDDSAYCTGAEFVVDGGMACGGAAYKR